MVRPKSSRSSTSKPTPRTIRFPLSCEFLIRLGALALDRFPIGLVRGSMLRRFATRRKQQLGQTLGTRRTGFLKNMPVDVQRKRHARMAQLLGDQPGWNTLAKSERSKTVTQIVETQVRQASTPQQRFETSLDEISFVDWAARRPLKDQIVWFKSVRSNAIRSEERRVGKECRSR